MVLKYKKYMDINLYSFWGCGKAKMSFRELQMLSEKLVIYCYL